MLQDKSFNPSEYASRTVNMYDGGVEEQTISIVCENRLMQNIIDRFGEDVDTDIEDEGHFRAVVQVKPTRTFFAWVFGFCGSIRIAEPQSVKASYEHLLTESLKCQSSEMT